MEGVRAGLADGFRTALEQAGVVVGEEAGAVHRARLLVGGERDDEVAPGAYARAHPVADDGEDHRVHVLHVDGAAPPDHAVAHLAGERVHAPVVRPRGDDVEMTVDEQGGGGGVGAREARDDVGAPRGALQERRFEAGVGELCRRVLGGGPLTAVAAAPVGGVDTDELGGEPDDFVQRPLTHRVFDVSHIAPPRRPRRSW